MYNSLTSSSEQVNLVGIEVLLLIFNI